MKTIKHINSFAISLPFVILISYPVFKEMSFIYALLSTMLTGFIQVCLAIKMLFDNPNDREIQKYIGGVFSFFMFWLILAMTSLNNFLNYLLIPIPLILAIYLSIIIYKKQSS